MNPKTQKLTGNWAPHSFPFFANAEEILSELGRIGAFAAHQRILRSGFQTYRIKDAYTPGQYRHTPIYQEFCHPQRIQYCLHSDLFGDATNTIGFHRQNRDFSGEDVRIVELPRSHLVQAHGNAQRVSHMQSHLTRINGAVEALNQGVVVLSSNGRIAWMTTVAQRFLKTFWPDWKRRKDSLPALLGNWVHSQLQLFDDPDYAPGIHMSITIDRGQYRLLVRLVPQDNQHVLFLEKEPIDLPLDRLNPYDLTSREKDVLGWAIQGKSNPEIGQMILGASPLTIQKQFGSIYQKLGVENRSAAVATALELMRLAR